MLVAALGVGVFAAYIQSNPNARRVPAEIRREEAPITGSRSTSAHSGPRVEIESAQEVQLPVLEGEAIGLGAPTKVPQGEKPIVFVANGALRLMKIDARALGVDVKDRVALIDFNPALNKGYGSMEESMLIRALQKGLGQFKEIDRFQILVEGETIESLGHMELTDPVPVIRPGASEPESTTPDEAPGTSQ